MVSREWGDNRLVSPGFVGDICVLVDMIEFKGAKAGAM